MIGVKSIFNDIQCSVRNDVQGILSIYIADSVDSLKFTGDRINVGTYLSLLVFGDPKF
jgi:hypothetical protein